MQVGINVTCMYTSFGGRGLSGFGDMATFQKRPNFPFRAWSSKNLIDRNRLKKFMQVGIDVTCMHINFGGCGLSGFGDKISLWSIKVEKINRSESAKKFMQVGINVTCMYTSFGGHGLSGFGDMATFQKRPNFPFGAWTIVHGHRKI